MGTLTVIPDHNQDNMREETPSSPRLVRELMTVGVTTCPLATPIPELTRIMLAEELEAVIVLDERGHAAGVVSWDELVLAYAAGDYGAKTAEVVMRADVPQVPPDIPLAAAAQIMRDLKTRAVFMMHHAGGIEYPAAILTYWHLLRQMAMREANDLSDLGIDAARKPPLELFKERRDAARQQAGLDKRPR